MNKEYSFYSAHTAGWRLLLHPPPPSLIWAHTKALQSKLSRWEAATGQQDVQPSSVFFFFSSSCPNWTFPYFSALSSLKLTLCLSCENFFTMFVVYPSLFGWLFEHVAFIPNGTESNTLPLANLAFPLVHLGLGNFPFLCRNSVQTCW